MAQIQEQVASTSTSTGTNTTTTTTTTTTTPTPVVDAFQSLWDESKYSFTLLSSLS